MYIESTPTALLKSSVLYYLKTPDGVTRFAGVDRLANFQSLGAARRIPAFGQMFPNDALIRIEIAHIGTHVECRNTMFYVFKMFGIPELNKSGAGYTSGAGVSVAIICEQTGEQFNSMTECALALGLSSSALSNHLNRKPGHNTVKGRTFRRV